MQGKRFAIVLLLISSVFFISFSVNAQSSDVNTSTASSQQEATSGAKKTLIQNRVEEAKENRLEKKEAFKAKLLEIRNEKKRALVERISTKLSTVNTNRTTHMSTVLEKINTLLNRLVERINTAKVNGKDIASVESALTQAQDALSDARSLVATQAAKTYEFEISSEEGVLKSNVGTVVSQFEKDLRDAHKAVVDAKQAVMLLIKDLNALKTSTVSPTIVISPTVSAE
ncbi:hypothetical protein COT62_02395 [Candidatus Roizmanbacteria bacterium CG09_land_8_20_14_0_10_41_9]|uniref:DUF5667 domain-containing protein n=1 Tax=Candidatus Roizmanbacteria bacterium CG09_land_8_20_14_0_10_41_9 TaxID=1974850 RepID=A0A2H0WST9_9BACT|nr:MAG: hypothetical protein COT62_02395 [Candidatus Roizmanbacteria bacterium CG09_land_8_20_14_0_10_41_9]